MAEYLAPGVYVEETSFRSKSIEGVSTTTTGFVGPARSGPAAGEPVLVTSLGEFAQTFGDGRPLAFDGGVTVTNYLWQAARAFFEEGGKRLYVARVFRPKAGAGATGKASKKLQPAGGKAVTVEARHPGAAGGLTVRVGLGVGQNAAGVDAKTKAAVVSPAVGHREVVWVGKAAADPPPNPPVPQTGTLYLVTRDPATGAATFDPRGGGDGKTFKEAELAADLEVRAVRVTLAAGPAGGPEAVFPNIPPDPDHRSGGLRDSLAAALDPNDPDSVTPVVVRVEAGADGVDVVKALADGLTAVQENKAAVPIPPRGNTIGAVTITLDGGDDGRLLDLAAFEGEADPDKPPTGLKALETAEDISIVAAPGHTAKVYGADQPEAVTRALIAHAERMRYRIAVLDGPEGATLTAVRKYRAKLDSTYAALYYPWVTVLDPVSGEKRDLPPSGFVAGIYARSDANLAVYKAPANEPVRLALGFAEPVNQGRQEVLNPEGITCFRSFEGRGNLLWGARTITSDSEWKYVNLRRYFAYLERSIDLGSQFAVYMPNGERLWANVRRAVSEFLLNEWQSGALLGERPEKAFFVKCDRSTMTQNDLDNGRLVCLVGVAPLRPAEFVIFRVGQWTGDRR